MSYVSVFLNRRVFYFYKSLRTVIRAKEVMVFNFFSWFECYLGTASVDPVLASRSLAPNPGGLTGPLFSESLVLSRLVYTPYMFQ